MQMNPETPRILFVDDDPLVLSGFRRAVMDRRPGWDAVFMNDPIEALDRVRREAFDTLVTDIEMPGMSGLQLLGAIKSSPDIAMLPVVVVTGSVGGDIKRRALDEGATDLLNKPVSIDELIARIQNSVKIKRYEDQLRRHEQTLIEQVRQKTAELSSSRLDILWRLAKAGELRDEQTGNHVVRVAAYSRAIAMAMNLDPEFIDTLFHAAPLHDIGKLGIPDAILLKPGKLTDSEWDRMRQHCEIGVSILDEPCKVIGMFQAISQADDSTGTEEDLSDPTPPPNPFLTMAAEIAHSHHERFDGAGYPRGLAGNQIPLSGRIVAVADVYDAVRSRRPYKEPIPVERAVELIQVDSGKHFDPAVVTAFEDAFDTIRQIERTLADDALTAGVSRTLMQSESGGWFGTGWNAPSVGMMN